MAKQVEDCRKRTAWSGRGLVIGLAMILSVGVFPCEGAAAQDELSFRLQDAQGREVRSQDYKGVPVFLEFGACW